MKQKEKYGNGCSVAGELAVVVPVLQEHCDDE
jgi:hypothetical protein